MGAEGKYLAASAALVVLGALYLLKPEPIPAPLPLPRPYARTPEHQAQASPPPAPSPLPADPALVAAVVSGRGYVSGWSEARGRTVAVLDLLARDRHAELEKLAADCRRPEATYSGPRSKLARFYLSFGLWSHWAMDSWQHSLSAVEAWKGASPQSATARLALANCLLLHASKLHNTPQNAGELERTLAAVEKQLAGITKAPDAELECARVEVELLRDRAVSPPGPGWYPKLEYLRACTQSPAWHGKSAEVLRDAGVACAAVGERLNIGDERLDWPALKASFVTMSQQYPDSLWVANQFCRYACTAKDQATARQLFEEIGANWELDAFPDLNTFLAQRHWAGAGPLAVRPGMPAASRGEENEWVSDSLFSFQLQDLRERGKFAELQEIARALTGQRTVGGRSRLALFYEALTDQFDGSADDHRKELMDLWVETWPDSEVAREARASLLMTGRSEEHRRQARSDLDALEKGDAHLPVLKIRLLQKSGGSPESVREVAARHPDNPEAQVAAAVALRDLGSPLEAAEFAAKTRDDALYALMADALSDYMIDPQLNWARVRKGFDQLLKRYPSSLRLLGNYAGLACIVGDRATARRLMALAPVPPAWGYWGSWAAGMWYEFGVWAQGGARLWRNNG